MRELKQLHMKDPVYKLIELTGTSTDSIEDAVDKAIKRAHKSIPVVEAHLQHITAMKK